MKILSKFKDYYDYYQGIFGMDNSKVYDRRNIAQLKFDSKATMYTEETEIDFYICGTQYRILEYEGVFYHTPEELQELDEKLLKRPNKRFNRGIHFSFWGSKEDKYQKLYNKTNGIKTDVNYTLRQPVLYTTNMNKDNFEIPLLTDFNFHRIMDAKELYIEIETFLGWLVDNPPLPDDQTNTGKIEGHGFDNKTSFRPKMK